MIDTLIFIGLLLGSSLMTGYFITRTKQVDYTNWMDNYIQGYKRQYRLGLRSDGVVVWQIKNNKENYN
jgi:hypothetical protein